MKKLIIYVMLVVMGNNFVLSQDIYSFPYPRTVDSAYFILSTNWGTVTELDSFNYIFLGENSDTVLVNCYYADWSWAQPTTCNDTMNFSNILTPKSYFFKFKIIHQIANIGNPICVDTFYYNPVLIYDNTKVDNVYNNIGIFKIYPNPTKEKINIFYSLKKADAVKLEIFNEIGELITLKRLGDLKMNNIIISTVNYVKGIYFVKLTVDNIFETKIIIIN